MAVSAKTREAVRKRARGLCEYCHADEHWQFVKFTIDHIIPQSKEKNNSIENLALACRNCNERRSNLVESADPDSGEIVLIFNPRADLWNDHFMWTDDGVLIVGTTSTGRATIKLLDLNDARHEKRCIRTRRRDIEDGFHPPSDDRKK